MEHFLSLVQQKPPKSVEDSLAPTVKAIISNELLNHALVDVKVSDLSCVTEITRISAPEYPCPDELMKVFNYSEEKHLLPSTIIFVMQMEYVQALPIVLYY